MASCDVCSCTVGLVHGCLRRYHSDPARYGGACLSAATTTTLCRSAQIEVSLVVVGTLDPVVTQAAYRYRRRLHLAAGSPRAAVDVQRRVAARTGNTDKVIIINL